MIGKNHNKCTLNAIWLSKPKGSPHIKKALIERPTEMKTLATLICRAAHTDEQYRPNIKIWVSEDQQEETEIALRNLTHQLSDMTGLGRIFEQIVSFPTPKEAFEGGDADVTTLYEEFKRELDDPEALERLSEELKENPDNMPEWSDNLENMKISDWFSGLEQSAKDYLMLAIAKKHTSSDHADILMDMDYYENYVGDDVTKPLMTNGEGEAVIKGDMISVYPEKKLLGKQYQFQTEHQSKKAIRVSPNDAPIVTEYDKGGNYPFGNMVVRGPSQKIDKAIDYVLDRIAQQKASQLEATVNGQDVKTMNYYHSHLSTLDHRDRNVGAADRIGAPWQFFKTTKKAYMNLYHYSSDHIMNISEAQHIFKTLFRNGVQGPSKSIGDEG